MWVCCLQQHQHPASVGIFVAITVLVDLCSFFVAKNEHMFSSRCHLWVWIDIPSKVGEMSVHPFGGTSVDSYTKRAFSPSLLIS